MNRNNKFSESDWIQDVLGTGLSRFQDVPVHDKKEPKAHILESKFALQDGLDTAELDTVPAEFKDFFK